MDISITNLNLVSGLRGRWGGSSCSATFRISTSSIKPLLGGLKLLLDLISASDNLQSLDTEESSLHEVSTA